MLRCIIALVTALVLTACAPLPNLDHATISRDPETEWLKAKMRYSEQMNSNIAYARRCHSSQAMLSRGCQSTIDELNELNDLSEEPRESGNIGASLGDEGRVDLAIQDLNTMIDWMRESIRKGS